MTAVALPWSTKGIADDELPGKMASAVASAAVGVRSAFADNEVIFWPDDQGGAYIVILGLPLGGVWLQASTWFAFSISYLYPEADCYPHYVRSDLQRADRQPLAPPFHLGNAFLGEPAVMISRSSPRRDAAVDTAALKAQAVAAFIRGHH